MTYTPDPALDVTETLSDLSFHLRRMADQPMDAIDADRLTRASEIVDDYTALRAERDEAMSESEGALMIMTQERAERDAFVAKLNTRIAALEADAQSARDQVVGAYARGGA